MGLLQKKVALLLGVHKNTITNWELSRRSPALPAIPKIICFLGYNPLPEGDTIPKRLRYLRKTQGLTQRELASILGVDASSVRCWETERRIPSQALLEKIKGLFPAPS